MVNYMQNLPVKPVFLCSPNLTAIPDQKMNL